jgi:ADP-ribose pyrophosphatase
MITRRRRRYKELRKKWPALFENPLDFPYEILNKRSQVKAAEKQQGKRLAKKHLPRSWRHTGVTYEDPYIIVIRDAVRFPNGDLGTYVRVTPASGSAGAAVLPLMDGKIVLLCHSRHATRRDHLEIPRGFGEPGVSALDLALLELREEIGAEAESAESLGEFHSNNGMATDCVELFIAHIEKIGQPQSSEGIKRVDSYTTREVAELIGQGEITDSFTIGAFTRALLTGQLPELLSKLWPVGGKFRATRCLIYE